MEIIQANCIDGLKSRPEKSVQMCVTSPPYYGLRDYGTAQWVGGDPNCKHSPARKNGDKSSTLQSTSRETASHKHEGFKGEACPRCGAIRIDDQIGLESSPELYVAKLVSVFREVWRVLADDGTLWLNLGDSYVASATGGSGSRSTLQGGKETQEEAKKRPSKLVSGLKPKDMIGIPWLVAFALRADGWYLRSDIIWHKPNPMPESVRDRPTKSHEYLFLLSKSPKYYYDYEAILEPAAYDGRKDTRMKGSPKYANGFAPTDENPNTLAVAGHERWPRVLPGIGPKHAKQRNRGEEYKPMRGYKTKGQLPDNQNHGAAIQSTYGLSGTGFQSVPGNLDAEGNLIGYEVEGIPARNKRDVWSIPTRPYKGAHFATFPPALIEPCILAGSRVGDTVLDPFNGSGTTGEVAIRLGRDYLGFELNPEYIKLSLERLQKVQIQMLP